MFPRWAQKRGGQEKYSPPTSRNRKEVLEFHLPQNCLLHGGQEGGGALTMAGHGCLQAVQRLLILTQVVGHVPIRVDCQEVSTTVERTDRVLVTGPLCREGGPHLGQRTVGLQPRGPGFC